MICLCLNSSASLHGSSLAESPRRVQASNLGSSDVASASVLRAVVDKQRVSITGACVACM
jgi:hypothetical protein